MTTLHSGNSVASPPLTGWVATKTKVLSSVSANTSEDPDMALDSHGNLHVVWSDLANYSNAGATDKDIFYRMYNTTTGTWTTTQVLSTQSTGYSIFPRIAIDSHDNLHVTWSDDTNNANSGTNYDIFYKMYNAATGTWTTTTVVSTESPGGSTISQIATDSHDNVHVVWQDYSNYTNSGIDSDIFYKMKNATTGTWTTTTVVSINSTVDSKSPNMVIDNHDNVHVTWDQSNGPVPDYDNFYTMKNATTGTWTAISMISPNSTSLGITPRMAVDSHDNLHLVWMDLSNYTNSGTDFDLFYRVYHIPTHTWTTTTVITNSSTGDSVSPSIALDSHDNLFVTWSENSISAISGSDSDILFQVLNATTGTWSPPTLVSTSSTAGSDVPKVLVDSHENLHFVWQDYTNYAGSGSDPDIFYKEFINAANVPVTTTQTTTQHQTETTTVVTTEQNTTSGSQISSSTSSTPWFILPTLVAIGSFGYIFKRRYH